MSRPVTGLVLVPVTPAPGMAGSAAAAAAADAAQDNDELPADASVDAPTAVMKMVHQSAPLELLRVQGPPPGTAYESTLPFGQRPRDTKPERPSALRRTGSNGPVGHATVPLSATLAAATQPTMVVEALRQVLQSHEMVQSVSGHVGADQRLYIEAVARNGNKVRLVLPSTITAEVGQSILFQLSAVLTSHNLAQPLQVKVRFESDIAFESECSRHFDPDIAFRDQDNKQELSAEALQRAHQGGIVIIKVEGPVAKAATLSGDVVHQSAVLGPQRITLRDLSQKESTLAVEFILPQSVAASVEIVDQRLINAKAQLSERLSLVMEGDETPLLGLFRAAAPAAAIAVLASAAYFMSGDAAGPASVALGGMGVWGRWFERIWDATLGAVFDRFGAAGSALPPILMSSGAPPRFAPHDAASLPPDSGDKTMIAGLPVAPGGPVSPPPSPSGRLHLDVRASWIRADGNVVAALTEAHFVEGHLEIELPKVGPAMQLSVGRMEGNGLKLSTDTVSRQHALITWDPQGRALTVTDRRSHNGTGLARGEALGPLWSKSDEFRESSRSLQFASDADSATVNLLPGVFIIFRVPAVTPE